MDFTFDEVQEELRRTARRFLDTCSSPERVRAAMATERGHDVEVWQRIGAELGWPSLIIPEAYGGAGLGHVELVAVMEEMGRALLCSPFFATVCLGASAILIGGSEEQKAEHLPAIAAGSMTATLALTEASGRWNAAAVEAIARPDGSDYLLSGVKTYVLDGHTADVVLVAARAPGSAGARGVSLFLVPASASGVTRRGLVTMDQTRRQGEIRLDAVRVPSRMLVGGEGEGSAILQRTLDLASIALSAEQVGGAERCLDMAVDYAKTRVQFGRPIGSFQAIKHKLAEMLMEVESARSASYFAGWTAESGDPELSVHAAIAKTYCSEAFFHAASENIQIHGGIGFTWEHDAHLYFKRARASEALFGDGTHHRETVARAIGLAAPGEPG